MASWKGVTYGFIFMDPTKGDMAKITTWIEEGKLKPIVGRTARLSDIKEVRAGCQQILEAKGGVGKFVVEIE